MNEKDNFIKENQYNIIIDEINVQFPYKPYENQIKYMKKVIELCKNKYTFEYYDGYGVFESPTGTGKTLCLLCSLLAWKNEIRIKDKFNGKIIYATRTHSQISQIIKELKKTIYKPKIAILSSREFSCINMGLKDKDNMDINRLNIICRNFRKKCLYRNNFDEEKDLNIYSQNIIIDIEDLCKEGEQKKFCPFYHQIKKAQNSADIIFMPYNYLINEDILYNLKLNLENNIIIIDEAHNLRNVCENEKSFEISENDFNDIIDEMEYLLKERNKLSNSIKTKKVEFLNSISTEEINNQIILVKKIKNKICEYSLGNSTYNKGKSISYNEFKYLINSSLDNLDSETNNDNKDQSNSYQSIIASIISLIKILRTCYESYKLKQSKIILLINLLSLVFDISNNQTDNSSYYLYICKEQNSSNIAMNLERKIKIFCFNPEIAFKEIINKKPFVLILTSGNLKPFDILEKELGIKFNIIFENNHIINDDQFKFAIIRKTEYKGEKNKFLFDLKNRNNEKMILSLGQTIFDLCKTNNKGGILVFFPSYSFLRICYNFWNKSKITEKIEKFKLIILDSFKKKLLSNKIINSKNKNFILLSVHRGSSSEGIDFSDDNARMVICVGIPFANISDDKISKKLKYLDNKDINEKRIISTGSKWYESNAMINVNQSLGRVIRNKNDYGVMICIDERYTLDSIKNLFSNWLIKNLEIRTLKDNDIFYDEINKFYDYCSLKYPIQNNEINNINIINNDDNNDIFNDFNFEKEINTNEFLIKRKREINYDNDDEEYFNINKKSDSENNEDEESIDNNNIDKELLETINNNPKFDHEQFKKLQNNLAIVYKSNISKCPICFTGVNQSIFLSYSISKCHHIICNICWNKIISSTKECPLCKRKVILSDLKKVILRKYVKN